MLRPVPDILHRNCVGDTDGRKTNVSFTRNIFLRLVLLVLNITFIRNFDFNTFIVINLQVTTVEMFGISVKTKKVHLRLRRALSSTPHDTRHKVISKVLSNISTTTNKRAITTDTGLCFVRHCIGALSVVLCCLWVGWRVCTFKTSSSV